MPARASARPEAPAPPELPGAYLRDLVDLVATFRITPEALLAGLPITPAALADPTTRVPLRVCEAVIGRAIELTRQPALAVHLGMRMRASSHGFLGFAAMTARNAGEALELAVRYAATRTSAVGLALYVEGDTASLVIEERLPLGAVREFVVIALLVGIWQLGGELTGLVAHGHADCAFPAPAFVRGLPLADRVRFDQPANRLVFDAGVLQRPFKSSDVVATRLAIEQCERELAEAADAGLVGQIRGLWRTGGAGATALPAVARALHLSPRTLKRRLADQGTTFSAIRDEWRRQRALMLLDQRALSIGEIAAKLGYTELPNFTRAFRKWTGLTPQAYRARARGG
jgi:AraC-like DNA-binding protein